MQIARRQLLVAGAGGLLQACANTPSPWSHPKKPDFIDPPGRRHQLAPLYLSEHQLMRITVCTRPFRGGGPRLEAERFAETTVIHNYGHGGSGWSLSWGCAEEATALALTIDGRASEERDIAVVGAGVIGLTTALRLIETGAKVTLYAREFPAETRSARATGVWSPSSRIGLTDKVAAGFASRWERWARHSYGVHQQYIGTLGHPVEFLPRFALSDDPRGPRIPATRDFLHLGRRLRDIHPRWRSLEANEHPFDAARARSGLMMVFNVAVYSQRLLQDFLARGGNIIRRDFGERNDILALPQPVIVNCTGYDAKRLWDDDSLEPVRGQINWLAPQANARYSLAYRNVSAVSRSDGVILQYNGDNEDFGFGDDTETPNRDEMIRTLETLRPVFG